MKKSRNYDIHCQVTLNNSKFMGPRKNFEASRVRVRNFSVDRRVLGFSLSNDMRYIYIYSHTLKGLLKEIQRLEEAICRKLVQDLNSFKK